MVLSRTAIERPVFATVISLLIVVLGVGALLRLPVREFPDVDPPTVAVFTTYPGASAEVVEREVTEVIEDEIAGISGIRTVTSTTRDQFSQISVEFRLEEDLDAAAADVRDAISAIRAELPEEADAPIISKTAAQAQAMMWITLTSDQRSRLALTGFAERRLVDPLSVVPGVANVIIGGARRYAMRIWLDPERMAALGVTVNDVAGRLRAQNVELPAGRIESEQRAFTVRSTTRLDTPEQFRDLIVRASDDYQVTLGDIAEVALGAESTRTLVLAGGEPAIGLGIVRQSQANTLEVASGIRATLEALRPVIPDDIRFDFPYDESVFIEGSIIEVARTLAIAMALVVAVIFLFLRSWRTTLIPAVTIPVSLVGTFTVLWLFGYSVNTLTLLALVLAIGLVVDDAIVVIENVTRHAEQGEPRLLAAARGSDQIGFAVVATTLVLVSVFVPLVFLTGDVGRLFTEFGVALAAAVTFSSLVALTMGAMLSSRLVRSGGGHGRLFRASERGFAVMTGGYRRAIEAAVRVPWLVLLAAAAVAAAAWFIYSALPAELAPTEDRGTIIIPVDAAEGATVEYTAAFVEEVRAVLAPLTGTDGPIDTTIAIVGPGQEGPAETNRAFIIVKLDPWGERDRAQQQIVDELVPQLLALPGARAFAVNPPSLGQQGFAQPVQFVIRGPTYEAAYRWAQQVLERAQDIEGLVSVRLDYSETRPQVRLSVDRARAAALGLTIRQIGETLQVLFGGQDITEFTLRGETYEVMVRAPEPERRTPEALETVYVRASNGELVSLRGVVELEEAGAQPELPRVDQLPAVTLSASLTPALALGDALAQLERIAAETLPPQARISYLGRSQDYQESSAAIYVVFALALVIVYLVLAAQFESFIHPLVIMLSVPLAITGGLASMLVTGTTFNIFSQIGLILLIGLMAKNGILIVEFANQLRDGGQDLRDAVVEASVVRLRPIVMTSAATICGGVPLVLSSGPGAAARGAIGVVVIGGMIVATLMVIFVVPVLYLLLARFTRPTGEVARRLSQLEQDHAAGPRHREAE